MAEPIRQEVVLPATPGRIYSAYMDSAEHEAFTNNGPASISDDVGGAFSCHGGAISGRNVELVAGKRIRELGIRSSEFAGERAPFPLSSPFRVAHSTLPHAVCVRASPMSTMAVSSTSG